MKDRIKKSILLIAIGIVVNVALAAIKMYVGLASNSLCIMLDAMNSFLDTLTCIVTLIVFIVLLLPKDEKMGLSLVAPPTITIISPEANLSRVPAWPTFSPLNLCFISLRLEKDVTSSPLSIRIMENSLPIFCHNLINESVDPFPFNVGVVLNEPEYRSILGLKDLCKPTLDKA